MQCRNEKDLGKVLVNLFVLEKIQALVDSAFDSTRAF